jgi:integrase
MPRGDKDGSIKEIPARREGGRIVEPARWIIKRRYTLKGQQREKKRVAFSATEALRKRRAIDAEIERELAGGAALAPTNMTVSQLVAHAKEHDLKPAVYSGETKIAGLRSWRGAWSALNPIEERLGRMTIKDVTAQDREDFTGWFLEKPTVHGKPRSITSLNRSLAWARRVFYIALKKKWITENPFAEPLIEVALEPKHLRILSSEEEARLFAQFTGKRKHLNFAATMALETMMRLGEQFRIARADIDLERRLLTALSYKGKRAIRRLIPITDLLLPRLTAELASHSRPLLFDYANPSHGFDSACRDAGIEGVTWHTLRHTGITRMVHLFRIEPIEVMKLSGHTVWKTFFETYVNIDAEIARAIGARIDAARAGAPVSLPVSVPAIVEVPPAAAILGPLDLGEVTEVSQ